MIKERLAKVRKALTGACEHPAEEQGKTEDGRHVCLSCGNEIAPPTDHFRSYVRMHKHLRLRAGIPTDRDGKPLSTEPTFNVGMRYVVPDNPKAIRRVWVTFDTKKEQKNFASVMHRRMILCSSDAGYNEVINQALDIIRKENPNVPEEVVERGEGGDE